LNKFHDLTATARWQRLAERELDWCRRFNRVIDRQGLERLFAWVSRLGDGMFWYALIVVLPLAQGYSALPATRQMAMVGLLCLAVYKWLKARTGRPRPYARHALIRVTVPPLDQYSFPSGHTLHAVAFSAVTVFHYPRLSWLLLPFTTLVALSRLVLGLHYPSDVLAGALLGAGLSMFVLQF
jgi:undecaprenyl-diphosphatase